MINSPVFFFIIELIADHEKPPWFSPKILDQALSFTANVLAHHDARYFIHQNLQIEKKYSFTKNILKTCEHDEQSLQHRAIRLFANLISLDVFLIYCETKHLDRLFLALAKIIQESDKHELVNDTLRCTRQLVSVKLIRYRLIVNFPTLLKSIFSKVQDQKYQKEAVRSLCLLSKTATKNLATLVCNEKDLLLYMVANITSSPQYLTVLSRLSIQTNARLTLSNMGVIQTMLSYLSQLEKSSPQRLAILTSMSYFAREATGRRKMKENLDNGQSGIQLITKALRNELLKSESSQLEDMILAIIQEFYFDHASLEIFKNFDLPIILVEGLSINRARDSANTNYTQTDWLDTDLIDVRDTKSADSNFTTQPGSGNLKKTKVKESNSFKADKRRQQMLIEFDSTSRSSSNCGSPTPSSPISTDFDSDTGSNLSVSSVNSPKFKRRRKSRSNSIYSDSSSRSRDESIIYFDPLEQDLVNSKFSLDLLERTTFQQNPSESRLAKIFRILEKYRGYFLI